MSWRVAVVAAGGLALVYPLASMAQWNADAAQTGANIYCEAIFVGRGTAEAQLAATQAMQQLIALGNRTLVYENQIIPPSVLERWSNLVDSLCPSSGGESSDHLSEF
ncbi:hypothetical protein KBY85_14240 [Cyanobium sp. BA5m-10]|uniref:hypothetical protein n=1 Tax=Cyanobium sp. BA5m-10 TaxID=2823705 RepID=UPI0020CD3C7F|nr:hypothetical protein [Cyanobium sp. BA5m-10]MCP9905285.1 hypothetical protein [Cyanobium sp. BA5m-10]